VELVGGGGGLDGGALDGSGLRPLGPLVYDVAQHRPTPRPSDVEIRKVDYARKALLLVNADTPNQIEPLSAVGVALS